MAATRPATDRADALNQSTDIGQAGVVFNDATRLLDGGLWSSPADQHNQPAYLGMYTTDVHAVMNDITAALANPAAATVNGTSYALSPADIATLQHVQGELQTLLKEAPLSVGHGHDAAAAQSLLHATQTTILAEINGDAALQSALAANPAVDGHGNPAIGFHALAAGADDAASLAAATAPGATLAQIGGVFNAAANLAVGGVNHANIGQFETDLHAVATGVQNILKSPVQLAQIEAGEAPADAAATTIHLQTIVDQINLQLGKFDHAPNTNVAARATNDNLLDIIDIVQGDANLATAAGANAQGTSGGFANLPSYLSGTITHFQDNQAQTNFWAEFLAEGNVINNQLQGVAAGNTATPQQLNTLIAEIQNYHNFGASFDRSQGGIFGARFDNELLGGTLKADTAAAVQGLKGIAGGDTGAALAADQAKIAAAGQGFAADAADVSGNNIPIGGGTYVSTATTVATATSVNGVAHGTIPVTGSTMSVAAGDPGHDHSTGSMGQMDVTHHVNHLWS